MTRDEMLQQLWDLEEAMGIDHVYHALVAYQSVTDLEQFVEDYKKVWEITL